MGEVLTLRTSGGRLWRTVRDPLAECLGELHGGPHECRLGGGTTLAARWRHRDSYDVDLTVSPGANLGSLRPRLDEAMTALGGTTDYRRGQWKIDFGTGQVDLSSLQPHPVGAQRTATVDDQPFIVLSTSQILNGKLERASRSPVRDVFDVIKARQLKPHALAVAVNAWTRVTAELVCMSWERANASFEKRAEHQLVGVPEAMREDPGSLGLEAAAAVQDALYKRVALHTENGLTIIETETRGGEDRRIVITPDEIDQEFAANGLNEYFYYNVTGGERMRDDARTAIAASTPFTWETGQLAPVSPDDQPPRHQPRNR